MLRLFVFLGSLLVLALLAALIAPPYIDWDQYKARFETEASRALGQEVTVDGSTSLRLLPLPSITFNDVKFGKTAEGMPLLTSKKFKMDMELAPLLKGDIVIVEVALEQPRFELRIDQAGRIEWPAFDTSGLKTELGADDVALENLKISQGIVRVRDHRFDREFILRDISATATAPALIGPWNAEAAARIAGEKYRLKVTTGQVQPAASTRLKVTLQPLKQPYDMELIGAVSAKNGLAEFIGGMTVRPMSKQSDEDRILFARPTDIDGEPDALPLRLESDITISSGNADMPAFKLDIGSREDPYVVTGRGKIELGEMPRFELRAEGQQLNVEQFNETSSTGASLAARWDVLRQLVENAPRPTLPGEASLYFPAIVLGDTVAREVGVDIEAIGEADWRLRNLKAQLPGRTSLEADGVISLDQGLSYSGDLLIASKQPSGFAKWLGVEASPEFRALTVLGLGAVAQVSPQKVRFDNAEIFLEDKSIFGTISREVLSETRPKLVAKLSGSEINFDQISVVSKLFTGDKDGNPFAGHDLDLDMNAGVLIASGVTGRDVKIKALATTDRIEIERLTAEEFEGAKISANGIVSTNAAIPEGDLVVNVTAKDATDLVAFVAKWFDLQSAVKPYLDNPALLADASLETKLSGFDGGYNFTAKGSLGGSDVDFKVKGDRLGGDLGEQKLDASLVAVNEDVSQLLLQMGVPVVPLGESGKGALKINLNGSMQTGADVRTTLTLRDGYLSGVGNVSMKDGQPNANLNVIAGASDLDPIIVMSGLALPGFGEGLQANAEGRWSFDGFNHEITDGRLRIEEAELSGTVSLDTQTKPRPVLSGKITGKGLDLPALIDVFSRPIYAETNSNLLNGLDGDLELSADDITLSQLMTVRDFSTNVIVDDGDILLEKIMAKADEAVLRGETRIAQAGEKRLVSGNLSVDGIEAKQLLNMLELPAVVEGRATASAAFETSVGIADDTLSNLSASGVISIEDGLLKNLDSSAFSKLLGAADNSTDETVLERSDSLLAATIFGGVTRFNIKDVPFNVSGGILRANAVQLKDDDLTLSGSGTLNLQSGIFDGQARVVFDAGQQVVSGALPEFDLSFSGAGDRLKSKIRGELFGSYLSTRLSEIRQREFEAQRSAILEKQRLQHLVRMANLKKDGEAIRAKEDARVDEIKRKAEEALLTEQQRLEKIEAAKRAVEDLRRKALDAAVEEKQKALKEAEREEDRLRAEAEERLKKLRALEEDNSLEFLDNEIIQ